MASTKHNDGKLFRIGDPRLNAHLHSYGDSELDFMLDAHDYLEGAQTLLKSAKAGDAHPSSVILPILYLYRHYLELQLKTLICLGMKFLTLLGASYPAPDYHHHQLMRLYTSVQNLLNKAREHVARVGQIDPRLEPPASPSADALQVLNEWNNWDPDSQTFRFPTKRTGSTIRPGVVNLADFEDAIRPLIEYLRDLDGWLRFYTSFVY